MACVLSEPDGRTVSSLTKAMEMPMPAVSRLMRGMEERGLITRSILPQDRRSIVVRVTAEGERLLDEFQESFHGFFGEVVNGEDPGDFDRAITGWNRLLDRMEGLLMERPAPADGKEECPPPPPCDPDRSGRTDVIIEISTEADSAAPAAAAPATSRPRRGRDTMIDTSTVHGGTE